MRNLRKQIILVFLISISFSQNDIYRSVEDVKEEWSGYTSFQKEEMISFCDFLFNEGYYERCLLSSFQLLYKFPNDLVIPTVNYYIARCYEEMENFDLAQKYYQKVIDLDERGSVVYRAAKYRNHYTSLISGNIDILIEDTQNTEDPYLLTLRGYAYLEALRWEDARTSFISAQKAFDHPHYDELMTPLYQTIENINSVPRHNKYIVFLSSAIFPGGGQFLLKEWNKGQGILSSVGLMMMVGNWAKVQELVGHKRVIENESSSIPLYKNMDSNHELKKKDKIPMHLSLSHSSVKYLIPPIVIGTGVFISSSLKSFKDTDEKNKKLIKYYVDDRILKTPPESFLDFPKPTLVIKK